MKIKLCFTLAFAALAFSASAQLNMRYDNINYNAIYFSEAAKLINSTPKLLILDVRSPGEYADTSQYITSNIGRLKGARNINIDSIPNHIKELEAYKDKPILVYCSHSQRSRLVSKYLGDQGFKQVYSLNGGMSLVNDVTDAEFPLKSKLYTSNQPYKLIESADAYKFIQNKNNLIIDVRPASEYTGTDTTEQFNIGRIKNAINIPADQIDKNISRFAADKNKPVLFYELNTADAVDAAKKFVGAGFKNVYVLYEGLETFIPNVPMRLRPALLTGLPKYRILSPKQTIDLLNSKPAGLVIADLRDPQEFANKAKESFHNLGHLAGAVNYTPATLNAALNGKPKNTPILLYDLNMQMNMGPSAPKLLSANEVARRLAAQGYTNVSLMYNGMYKMVWSVTNKEDCRNGRSLLVDHAGLY